MTVAEAIALLQRLGATPWLVRHHELVVEAAEALCRVVRTGFDRDAVLAGAALHDAGKIAVPAEMSAPGHAHEAAGQALLCDAGVDPAIARFCVTHARWDADDATLEDLLVALADKLWKGKRVDDLEQRAVARIAAASAREAWEVFDQLDAAFEAIAAGGDARLARSNV